MIKYKGKRKPTVTQRQETLYGCVWRLW